MIKLGELIRTGFRTLQKSKQNRELQNRPVYPYVRKGPGKITQRESWVTGKTTQYWARSKRFPREITKILGRHRVQTLK